MSDTFQNNNDNIIQVPDRQNVVIVPPPARRPNQQGGPIIAHQAAVPGRPQAITINASDDQLEIAEAPPIHSAAEYKAYFNRLAKDIATKSARYCRYGRDQHSQIARQDPKEMMPGDVAVPVIRAARAGFLYTADGDQIWDYKREKILDQPKMFYLRLADQSYRIFDDPQYNINYNPFVHEQTLLRPGMDHPLNPDLSLISKPNFYLNELQRPDEPKPTYDREKDLADFEQRRKPKLNGFWKAFDSALLAITFGHKGIPSMNTYRAEKAAFTASMDQRDEAFRQQVKQYKEVKEAYDKQAKYSPYRYELSEEAAHNRDRLNRPATLLQNKYYSGTLGTQAKNACQKLSKVYEEMLAEYDVGKVDEGLMEHTNKYLTSLFTDEKKVDDMLENKLYMQSRFQIRSFLEQLYAESKKPKQEVVGNQNVPQLQDQLGTNEPVDRSESLPVHN